MNNLVSMLLKISIFSFTFLALTGCNVINMDVEINDSVTKMQRLSANAQEIRYKVSETYLDMTANTDGNVTHEKKTDHPKKMFYTFLKVSEQTMQINVDIEDQYGTKLNYMTEAEFVRGSWGEFQENQPVEISLTAKGRRIEERRSMEYLRSSMEREINREYAGRLSVSVSLLNHDLQSSNFVSVGGILTSTAKGSLSLQLNVRQ